MDQKSSSIETLNDIKKMMEKSSRFISLSGWSGIAAGICGLAGALLAKRQLNMYSPKGTTEYPAQEGFLWSMIILAAITFIAAFISAFIFTFFRSKKTEVPIWGSAARRLLWNTMIPMIAGGILILQLIQNNYYELIAPCTLIFYGLALINGSKYTLGEIRFLGYLLLLLGFLNLWFPQYWLLFWATGFGALHILYGIIMWRKYERK